MAINGIIAIVIAYLLGSIPGAYITTRIQTGKDIRKLGSGNAGAHNVYRNVGTFAAIVTGLVDLSKGGLAVSLALRIMNNPDMKEIGTAQVFVLMAALAVVAGHIWAAFLRFTGGNGLSPLIGALAILLPMELLWALAMTIVMAVFTRNIVLSVNICLIIVVPFTAWRSGESGLFLLFLMGLVLMLVLHFVPDMRAAYVKAGNRNNLVNDLLRIEKTGKK